MAVLRERYQWVIDRMAEAFGADKVLLAEGADAGKTLAVGVRHPGNSQVLGFIVEQPARPDLGRPAIALNDQEDRERFIAEQIARIRARMAR